MNISGVSLYVRDSALRHLFLGGFEIEKNQLPVGCKWVVGLYVVASQRTRNSLV